MSHDRHFVASVGRRVLALTPGHVEDFHGGYDEYLEWRGDDYLALARTEPRPGRPSKAPKRASGRGYAESKEQRRATERLTGAVARLEGEIARLERELDAMAARYNDNGYYHRVSLDEIRADERRQRELREQLEAAMREWEAQAMKLEARRAKA